MTKRMQRANKQGDSPKRGRKSDYSDMELKKMALQIKNDLKGAKLTYKELERRSGIGRNTWSRRIPDTINELNRPIMRSSENNEIDAVYFPNIHQLFEVHGKDYNKIIYELEHFQDAFYQMYKEKEDYKQKLEKLSQYETKLKEQEEQIRILKIQKEHYEKQYKNILVTSAFPHLREENGIKYNLLDFNAHVEQHSNLDDLKSLFITNNKNTTPEADATNEHFERLKERNKRLFNKKGK
ncbi:hypothetical protein [Cohnella thermotolerans]|uniref:hypothetical protein n=1 Tax=Cohnella thermotolerans TaxID=329858 RepID=UPI0006865602|nr:hypothetical protein [Cohnella thermotolerans]